MPAKAVVLVIALVFLTGMAVAIIEYFVPLSAKLDMNLYCREAMLRMEIDGGLTSDCSDRLEAQMTGRGFHNIQIEATSWVKQGEELVLHVEGDYSCSSLAGFFSRVRTTVKMIWERTSCARKVVN